MHCIDKHQFPRNYDFFIINDGIDRRTSMLRHAHRRRSSTVNSTAPNTGRRRGQSFASTAGDGMDVVNDEIESQAKDLQESASRTTHVKLRGRGGFSHPQGAGRGRGSNDQAALGMVNADPVDKLTSSMSALQFVPPSVRLARGRGRGRGV